MRRVKTKAPVGSQSLIIVVVTVSVLSYAAYITKSSAQKNISISLVGASDVTESLRDSYRVVCRFTYEVKNQLGEEAFIGPFTMRVANARLPVAIAPASVGSGERYALSANGVHKLPCREYRMDPWLDVLNCSTKSGVNCLHTIKHQTSRKNQ